MGLHVSHLIGVLRLTSANIIGWSLTWSTRVVRFIILLKILLLNDCRLRVNWYVGISLTVSQLLRGFIRMLWSFAVYLLILQLGMILNIGLCVQVESRQWFYYYLLKLVAIYCLSLPLRGDYVVNIGPVFLLSDYHLIFLNSSWLLLHPSMPWI